MTCSDPLMVSLSNHERQRSSFDKLRTSGDGFRHFNCAPE
jgi:hypothetical protein